MKITRLIFCFFIMLSACGPSGTQIRLSAEEQAEFISKGKKITMISFRAFSKEVMNALNEGGVEHAVGFCHLRAGTLTDSLEEANQVRISRISDKFRNPSNKPGELDLTILKAYQEQLASGQDLQPHLEVAGKEIIFYSPILILNPVCLNCHGKAGSTLSTENAEYIKSLYPGDQATEYILGDLRGAWKIVFLQPETN